MNGWIVFAIVMASIATYSILAGVTYQAFLAFFYTDKDGHMESSHDGAVIASVVWPVTLPMAFGRRWAVRLQRWWARPRPAKPPPEPGDTYRTTKERPS